MVYVDNSQITPLYANTSPGLTADASVVDPAIAALVTAINTNADIYTAFITALELPIPDQSIVTRHLRNLAVTNSKLAPLAVTADKIADGSITLAKLADLVVTAAKIANGTITEAKYATGSVSSRAIGQGEVKAENLDPTLLTQYGTVATNAKFELIDEQLAETEQQTSQAFNLNPDGLRIAFHFNYENNQGKLNLLKTLGFNTVWMYKQAVFTFDTARMLAFLDRLQLNGLQAIVQVDFSKINSDDAEEIAYVNSLKDHIALAGFTGFDEPIGHAVSRASQESFYTKMKSLTSRPIFQVDNDSSYNSMVNYYAYDTCDVFCIDVYVNHPDFANSLARKKELFSRISGFMNFIERKPHKHFVPVLPAFAGEGFTLPTAGVIDDYVDVLSQFHIKSYGFFAFDVTHNPSSLSDTIDNNDTLKQLCVRFKNSFYSIASAFKVTPRGFDKMLEFISKSGFTFANGYGFDVIGTTNGTPSLNSMVYRLNRTTNNDVLVIHAGIRQVQDADIRKLLFHISYDGTTWEKIFESTFGATPSGTNYKEYKVLDRSACVYVKLEIDCTGAGVAQTQDFIGFTNIMMGIV